MAKNDCNSCLKAGTIRLNAYVEELRKNPNAAKILFLKLVMLSFLIAAATTITILSQRKLEQAEYRLFESRFNSVSDNAIIYVADSLSHVNVNVQELSVTYGHVFPGAAQWPNVAWKGFHPTAALLSNISSVGGMGIIPLVLPHQVPAYQTFINEYYNTDPYCQRAEYINEDFPNGEIWSVADPTEYPFRVVPDPYGNTTDSPYQILAPLSQYTVSAIVGPQSVSYNIHGNAIYTKAVDMVIDCTTGRDYSFASTSCGTATPAIPVPIPSFQDQGPAVEDMVAVFLHPIFPADNQSTMVGFAAGTFGWKALLTNVIPPDVSDVDVVVEADGRAFSFCIEHGIPYFMGEGSLQESAYTHMRRRSTILGKNIAVSTGAPYVVNFYPTKAFQQQFQTERPKRGALVLFCSFMFCTILFFSYDVLLQREFDRNQAVLDTKRRFVRFISHEIRTPLNTVRLGMKLLEVELTKFTVLLPTTSAADLALLVTTTLTAWKQLVDEIVESSESAVEVLNDLLNYDKIELGTMKLELSYFNMRDVLEKTVAAMQVQAQQKGVALELSCVCLPATAAVVDVETGGVGDDDEDEIEERTVVGDVARMAQVLRNLVSNALKFTPSDGHVNIAVTFSNQIVALPEKIRDSSPIYQGVTQVGTLMIAVKDSGAGLSPQQLAEICAEGVQFNANELQAGQGSGLGLFISKGIVEQHGGRLVVESEGLGHGVTFTVEMPLFQLKPVSDSMRSQGSRRSRSESLNSEHTTAVLPLQQKPGQIVLSKVERAAATAAVAAGHTRGRRLLVVDDSVMNCKLLIRLLSARDHVCEQAEDGEVAIRKYLEMVERGEPPDAILMDYEMPVMNGPTATARLRELGCTCLIVGVTGNVLSQDVEFFIEHGANSVLPKPIVIGDFEQLLAGTLLRRAGTVGYSQPLAPIVESKRKAHFEEADRDPERAAHLAESKKPIYETADPLTASSVKIHPAELV